MTKAIGLIQTVTRAWLTVKKNSELNKFRFAGVPEVPSGVYSYLKVGRLVKFIGERHSFVNLRRSVFLIQHVARIWVAQRRDASCPILIKAAIVIQKCFRGWVVRSLHMIENASRKWQQKGLSNSEIEAATGIQIAWKNFVSRSLHKHTFAATKIQSHFRGWQLKRNFMKQKQAIITIQSNFRQFKCSSTFQQYKAARIENASFKYEEKSLSIGETEAASRIQIAWKNFVCRYLQKQTYAATKIQSHYRAWQLRRSFIKQKQEIIKIQSNFRRLKCWWAFQIAQKEFVCRSLQNQTFAATKIQSHFRGWQLRRSFVKQKQAIIAIQSKLRQLKCSNAFQQYKMAARSAIIIQSCVRRWIAQRRALRCRYLTVAIQRHCRGWLARKDLLKQRNAVIKIQRAIRCVICQKAFHLQKLAAIEIQRAIRGQISRKKLLVAVPSENLQRIWFEKLQEHLPFVRLVLPRHCRGWLVRKDFSLKRDSVIKIQRAIRCLICQKAFHLHKLAAIDIQRVIRGQLSRSRLLGASSFHVATAGSYNCKMSKGFFQSFELKLVITSVLKLQRWWRGVMLLKLRTKSAIIIQSHARGWIAKRETCRQKHCIVVIQRQSRGWLVRKDVLLRRDSVIKIQRAIRSLICQKAFHLQKLAAIDIQSVIRGQIARSRLLGATSVQAAGGGACNCNMAGGFFRSFELTLVIISVLKLQRWWRGVLLLKSRARSVIIIQTHARGWIARQKVYRKRTCIVVIQSYWKGYVARKESREQLLNLRLRMQKSAMNVDDSRRLINRLLSALSELLSMKSIRGILHNCETLDMATAHSLKCCEELVAAGAITILLKLIRAASRSIPDQQVLKHALSTLRNLARYPHLTQVLIDTPASVETILWELHRNKEEGYFIASQILKKICSNENGVITVHKFPALLKRLYNLVEELTRKAYNEKRNPRAVAVRDNTDRRLKEAVELLKLITNGYKSSKLPIAFAM
ncbi:Abnormal spindle-like microcephaly-associated protein [Gossypium arboreum]|uniref:Abnormal spindle-like microcephaly-associated protein n=1 Tax=Gossypium arboreum TaxID=29729 RepID=A0A0B0NYL3_GOSAR|nr:Abnormal spindle-like microcephaly-associated protein [Gossypium arboreum]